MKKLIVFLTLVLSLGQSSWLYAYKPETHREIAKEAAVASSLNQVLEELGFSQTVDKLEFSEKSVQFWVGEGAHQEDRPIYAIGRVRNHFHNPLQRWDIAGLENGNMGYSSIVWSQLPPPQTNEVDGGSYSWAEARLAYSKALTKSVKAEREKGFTNTFLTLGHLVHLVQDASVPAHTRDDIHLVPDPWDADDTKILSTNSRPPGRRLISSKSSSPLPPALILIRLS